MKHFPIVLLLVVTASLLMVWSCKKDDEQDAGVMQLSSCTVGSMQLNYPGNTTNVPYNEDITINFSASIDSISAINNLKIKKGSTETVYTISFKNDHKTVILSPLQNLEDNTEYILDITSSLRGQK
jgi:hypothetical protein